MEKHYEFRQKLLQIHKPNRINDTVWKIKSGLVIDECWSILVPEGSGAILNNAAKDLQQYLDISMNRCFAITHRAGENQIRLQVSLKEGAPAYRIAVGDCILLDGTSEKMTAQAVYALEDQMNMNEGPVITVQDQVYRPMFSLRMVHSGMGFNIYPNEHLCAIAHAGMNAIIANTGGILENPALCNKVKDICVRAADYGIDVYTVVMFKNRRHPSEPDAWEHYDSMYGELFRRCPQLKGILLIGESCEFPSRDPRTTGKSWRDSLEDKKPSPGWFPCNDYPEFATMLRDVVHAVKPDAHVIFWTYNWGYAEADLRTALIDQMPTEGVTVMTTYEVFEEFQIKPGVLESCVDYTLWFPGPSKCFTTEAEAVAKRGIDFMTMCNTGGNTWDVGDIPYLPAPSQWIKRYEGIVEAAKNTTLSSLLESWTYGFWPSFISELTKAAYTQPQPNLNVLLRQIAIRDYGEGNADAVLDAWECFAEGVRHCISTNEEQYGPCRIGPSYPLLLIDQEQLPIGPESTKNPNNTCCSTYRFNPDDMERLVWEIGEYEKMVEAFAEGNKLMSSVISNLDGYKKKDAEEALTVTRFIENTARTVTHVKRWHKAKIHLGIYVDHKAIWTGGQHDMADAKSPEKPLDIRSDRGYWIQELISIGNEELKNARDTIDLVRANSRLGYTQELDYVCSEEQLLWKIAKLETVLAKEIKTL